MTDKTTTPNAASEVVDKRVVNPSSINDALDAQSLISPSGQSVQSGEEVPPAVLRDKFEASLDREVARRQWAGSVSQRVLQDASELRREADEPRRQIEVDQDSYGKLLYELRIALAQAEDEAKNARGETTGYSMRADLADREAREAKEQLERLADRLKAAERRIVQLWDERLPTGPKRQSLVEPPVEAVRPLTREEEEQSFAPNGSTRRDDLATLNSRVRNAELTALRAKAGRNAAERKRQISTQKLAQLRQAFEAVGIESKTTEEMFQGLAERYESALADLSTLREGGLGQVVPRAWSGLDPLYIEEISRSIYFDPDWYSMQYPDVADSEMPAAVHYLLHGALEHRDPGPWFSSGKYFRNNPDVADARANPLLHFIRHGNKEGRSARLTPAVELPPTLTTTDRERFSCIFVTGEPESAGHRYRVLHLVEAAEACDVSANWVRADDLAQRHEQLASHDVAVFWRVAWTPEIGAAVAHLRSRHRVVVFDVDDLMTEPSLAQIDVIDGIRTQSLTEEGVRSHYDRIRETMLNADVCLTTTEELALYLRGAGKTTHVIPNGFDRSTHNRSRFEMRRWRAKKPDGLIRVGYAGGSHTHQRDFGVAVEAVAELLRENERCRLVLFRSRSGPLIDPEEFPALRGLEERIEWRNAVPLPELPLELARFDINIAPLEFGNPYCEAKSELKFFESALVDVPTIASPTGPFRRAIEHGKTGYLAASADDWYHSLKLLVDDPGLRARIGRAAYHSSLARFGPETRILRLACILEQLKGGAAGARGFALDAQLATRKLTAPSIYPSKIVFERDKLGTAEVSVVIPLYNYEAYIEETLDSVRAQTAAALDLIIVDGFSTDRSLAVARDWAKRNADRFNRIVVMQNAANYGLALCRNSGIDAAETPYVLLLDADNKLLPEASTELAGVLRRTNAAFAYSSIQHFGASTALIGNTPFEARRLAAGNYIDAMALVSKEAWAMIGGVDHVRHGWEDYDFWCRLAEVGLRGEWVERTLALYRVHPKSMQAQETKVPDNLRRLMENFKERHPWTSLIGQESLRVPPAPMVTLTAPAMRTRLDDLLPILRCPETHQKLGYNEDRTKLLSFDGLRSWPILDGRPQLSRLTLDTDVRPAEHISNFLPAAAVDLIRATSGLVLNLSAGGTAERIDNVVEVEFSLFRNTDVAADAHELPFDDEVFEAVIVINAFEHYRDPQKVIAELHRVLKPGAKILVATAFLQPLHEKPWHFYNCTRYGLEEWFHAFQVDSISVTDNFSPNFTIGWVTSEAENALRTELGDKEAMALMEARVGDFVTAFRDESKRQISNWNNLHKLSQPAQETIAAGFEMIGRKPLDVPVVVR